MATATLAGNVGERLIARWLEEFGYSSNIDTQTPNSTVVEARGSKSLLVQVKSAVQPAAPDALSPDEVRNLTSRAAGLGFEAWEARVQLDEQLRQVGDIQWRKLT